MLQCLRDIEIKMTVKCSTQTEVHDLNVGDWRTTCVNTSVVAEFDPQKASHGFKDALQYKGGTRSHAVSPAPPCHLCNRLRKDAWAHSDWLILGGLRCKPWCTRRSSHPTFLRVSVTGLYTDKIPPYRFPFSFKQKTSENEMWSQYINCPIKMHNIVENGHHAIDNSWSYVSKIQNSFRIYHWL